MRSNVDFAEGDVLDGWKFVFLTWLWWGWLRVW